MEPTITAVSVDGLPGNSNDTTLLTVTRKIEANVGGEGEGGEGWGG